MSSDYDAYVRLEWVIFAGDEARQRASLDAVGARRSGACSMSAAGRGRSFCLSCARGARSASGVGIAVAFLVAPRVNDALSLKTRGRASSTESRNRRRRLSADGLYLPTVNADGLARQI